MGVNLFQYKTLQQSLITQTNTNMKKVIVIDNLTNET